MAVTPGRARATMRDGGGTDAWGRPVSAYGVKQFVARVQRADEQRFNVFTTGDDTFYLFDPIDAQGCSYGQAWPVLRTRLPKEWRHHLAHGRGNVADVVAPTSGRSPVVQVSADLWAEALRALQREDGGRGMGTAKSGASEAVAEGDGA